MSTAFINFLQPYLSDHKNPAVFIIYLQLHLSVCKTSLCQFLTPLRTLQSLLISYNPIYLVTNALELRSSFNNPIIILKNFIRLHQFLTPLLIGPKFTNSFYQFLTTLLVKPRKLSSLYQFFTTLLIGSQKMSSFYQFLTTLFISSQNSNRFHKFLTPLLIGPNFFNSFYQFFTALLIGSSKSSNLFIIPFINLPNIIRLSFSYTHIYRIKKSQHSSSISYNATYWAHTS